MARYIDLDKLLDGLEDELKDKNPDDLAYLVFKLFIGRLSQEPVVDVVPKSEEGAECPTCYGTGRIGTTNWLTKNISKKQLAEEKAKAIAEHEQYIKTEYAREIFEEIEKHLVTGTTYYGHAIQTIGVVTFAELKKKYTEESVE